MANNQKKLKAFVRYDGSGRVVASSLILRKNKPRVGRWFEIPTYECCNGSGTTTTTTTQGSGGMVTAFLKGYWTNPMDSCIGTITGNLLFYSTSSELVPGISVFQDVTLTIPVTTGYVINADPFTYPRLIVGAGGVITVHTC